MKKWKCFNCGCEFSDPIEKQTTYEGYYGVASEFSSSTPTQTNACPICESECIDIIEIKEKTQKAKLKLRT